MAEIKILHLSDLHFDGSRPKDTEIILNALWKDLDNFKGIDFILFTGDLVKAGDKKDDFEKTFQIFIKPLLEKTKLKEDNFFIAPGNHDIQRGAIDEIIEEGLKVKLVNRDSLNSFLDRQIEDGFPHIERLNHFNDFKSRFNTGNTITSNKLFSTHMIKRNNVKIGIACLNTSWRATGIGGGQDKGRLLIGELQIYASLSDIKDCDIKIALYHHSLDWLREYDFIDAKKLLSREFDFIFCGHLHDSNLELVQHLGNPATLIQGGCLYKSRAYYNGYSVLSLDVQEEKGTVYLRSYFNKRRSFDKAVDKCENGIVLINLKKKIFHHKNKVKLLEIAKEIDETIAKRKIVQKIIRPEAEIDLEVPPRIMDAIKEMEGIVADSDKKEEKPQEQINQFYRYTKVDCPQECSLNDEIELSVQLTIKKPLETVVRQIVQIPVDNLEKSVKLTLKMTAPDFQVDYSQKTMNVPIDEDSDKVVFKMKPLSVGKHIIEIEIYWNALRIGFFALEIEVMAVLDHPDPPADIVCYENPGSFIGYAFKKKPIKKKAEGYNTLHVTWDGVSKLTYALYPGSGPPEGDWEVENIGAQESLQYSLNDLVSLITDIAQKKYLNKEEELSCLENMRGIGSVLFEKFIPEYLRFKIKEWPPGEILCISTTEQWIPWELIYDGNGFWGERFLIFRLPRVKGNLKFNDQKTRNAKVKPGTDIINIIHVLGGEIKDIYTERAKNVFKIAETQASIITLEKSNLSALIKQIGKADLLHFTCHGYNKPSLYLQISDKQDKQLNLRFEALKSENFSVKNGSIIFSNACNSSSPSVIFGDFVNFGWEFYRKGAAVFIGTIGTIPTEYAIEFSENFYNRLFKSNAGVANAFREAKKEMNKKNNFFHLLYCLYANPILVR